MQISVTELYTWIEAGSKITGDKDTDFFLSTNGGKLYLIFLNPQIQYCKRIECDGDIAEICLDLPIFRSMLKGKKGTLEIVTNKGTISLKGSGFKYSLDGISKEIPNDVFTSLFSKKGKKTDFINIPQKIVKSLSTIRDRVTDSKLAVRVVGKGNLVKFLLTDNHHGLLITQKFKEEHRINEIILPIDTFLKVINVAASKEAVTFEQTESDIVVQTKSEYLACRLKAMSNAHFTFDMMEGLLASKSSGACEIKTDELLQALNTCQAIIASAPVTLAVEKNTVLISMNTAFSKTSERIKATVTKPFTSQLNVTLLMEITSTMFEKCTMSVRNGNLNLESTQEGIKMQGMCVGYVEEEDDDD